MNETAKMNSKVYWVANNPLEIEHARAARVLFPPERYRLLRPTGWSSLRGALRWLLPSLCCCLASLLPGAGTCSTPSHRPCPLLLCR